MTMFLQVSNADFEPVQKLSKTTTAVSSISSSIPVNRVHCASSLQFSFKDT